MKNHLVIEPTGGLADIIAGVSWVRPGNAKRLVDGTKSVYKTNFGELLSHPTIEFDSNKIEEIIKNTDNKLIAPGLRRRARQVTFNPPFKIIRAVCYAPAGRRGVVGFFHQLIFSTDLLDTIKKRYLELDSPYISLQIRNSDIKTPYASFLQKKHQLLKKQKSIHLATDDADVVRFCKEKYPAIHNFTSFGAAHPKTKWKQGSRSEDIPGKTQLTDAICDLILGMAASQVIHPPGRGAFPKLMKNLHQHPINKKIPAGNMEEILAHFSK